MNVEKDPFLQVNDATNSKEIGEEKNNATDNKVYTEARMQDKTTHRKVIA